MANRTPQRRDDELPAEYQARVIRARMEARALRAAEKLQKAALANYQAAGRGRQNRDWKASPGSADMMILPDGPLLNARARQTVRDTWIGASMVRAAKRNVSGTGIRVVPAAKAEDGTLLRNLNKRARADFQRWAKDKQACDLERRQNFYQKQRLAVSERYTVGQHFIVWSYRRPETAAGAIDYRLPVGLRLQSFEPEQLDLTLTSYQGREVRGGIELDPETNAAVAYHFYTRNPNDYLSRASLASRRVEAWQVLHYFDQERVLQTQGATQMAPVLQEVRDFNRFKEATLWRAMMEACIGMVVTKNSATPNGYSPLGINRAAGEATTTATGMNTIDFVPGMTPHLAEGETVTPFTPASPGNQYDPFTTVTLRGIGAGVGMSYDQISRHSDANYSAARQNMLEDWREWEPEQDNLIADLILPIYTLFFNLSVLEGRFDDEAEFDIDGFTANPDRFTDAACIAPARPWIDPEKEANAFTKLIDYRLVTREEIVTGRGKQFAEEIHTIGQEKTDADGEGVKFPEDVEAQATLDEAKSKVITAEAAVQKADNTAPTGTPNADPGQPPPTKISKLRSLAQADRPPNYKTAPSDGVACMACRYFLNGTCQAYEFATPATGTCDAFEVPPVSSMNGGGKSMGMPLVEGEPSIDNTAANGFTPDARLS
jgi:lambda family phage portal protein